MIPYKPSDMYFTTETTKKTFQHSFDEFGDSYVEDTNAQKLREIFANMKPDKPLNGDMIQEIEERFFSDTSQYGLFRRCK